MKCNPLCLQVHHYANRVPTKVIHFRGIAETLHVRRCFFPNCLVHQSRTHSQSECRRNTRNVFLPCRYPIRYSIRKLATVLYGVVWIEIVEVLVSIFGRSTGYPYTFIVVFLSP
jgi:hypothetical protein